MTPPMSPKTAELHFRSSHQVDVGAGIALRYFCSSISKAATRQAYAP